ncbi:hypothetical protein [Aquipuribacter hungaricus]
MSPEPAQAPRRALGGLPPRTGSPASVTRLIRSNRLEESGAGVMKPPAVIEAPTDGKQSLAAIVTESQTYGLPDSQSQTPKYLQLVRREARMHAQQVADLANLTRALNEARRNGARSGTGERITDNTLVRVAIDLLLEDPGRLRGTTEDELRASVGLPPLQPASLSHTN